MNANYYKITANVAYTTPIYVHSHATSLLESQRTADAAVKATLSQIKKEINNIFSKSLQQAEDVYTFLYDRTNELLSTGFDFNNVFGYAKDIFINYIEPYRQAIKNNKVTLKVNRQTKEEIVQLLTNDTSSGSVVDIITDTYGTMVAEIVRTNLKKITKAKNMTDINIEDLTVDDLKKEFKGRGKHTLSKQFAKDLVKTIVHEDVADLNAFFTSLCNNFLDIIKLAKGTNENKFQELEKRIYNIQQTKNTLPQKMGKLKEITDCYGLVISIGGWDAVELVSDDTHALTSDILLKLDTIATGISVKLNPKRLAGRSLSLLNTNSSMVEGRLLKQWLDSYDNIYNILLYYLINYEALSTFAVHFDDTKIREDIRKRELTAEDIDYKTTNMSIRGLHVYNLLEDLRQAVFLGLITKLLLGYAFGIDNLQNFDDVYSTETIKKGLPLILLAGDKVIWTKDILKNCIDIIKDMRSSAGGYDYRNSNFHFYSDQKIFKKGDLLPHLTNLFIAKVNVAKGDGTGNRYEELKSDPAVLQELTAINNLIKINNGDDLSNLLLNKWGIRYDYSNLQ